MYIMLSRQAVAVLLMMIFLRGRAVNCCWAIAMSERCGRLV
jgi:hypothetical protein